VSCGKKQKGNDALHAREKEGDEKKVNHFTITWVGREFGRKKKGGGRGKAYKDWGHIFETKSSLGGGGSLKRET